MTILQQDFALAEHIPPKNLYPVTLPLAEAAQCLKVVLANAVMDKRGFFPLLSQINFTMTKCTLIYLPFKALGLDIIQEDMGISINKSVLKYGRYL
jgi:hypothetical protein